MEQVKERLKLVKSLDRQIQCNFAELNELKERAIGISGVDYEKIAVCTSPETRNGRFIKVLEMLETLEAEIITETEELMRLRHEIRTSINLLDNAEEQSVLRYRYVMGFSWESICKKTGFSRRQANRVHDSAINKISSF